MPEITSPANPRVKWLVGLRRRREREAAGVTLIEGFDELTLALAGGVHVRTLFFCPDLVGAAARLTLMTELAGQGVEVVHLGRQAFTKASYRESPDGWLAVVANPARRVGQLTLGTRPLVLVAESIEKPGNLGAMLRTADAAGVDAVVAASPVTDWGNPNVIRASRGTVFAVPIASATTAETIDWLHAEGLTIVVATPETHRLVTDVDLTGDIAFVVGAEHQGVSETWLDAADVAARIAMAGRVNSLNVATSAAIVLYEALRQRTLKDGPGALR